MCVQQVCSCLGQIAKHSVDLAEVVVEAEIFPKILTCLKDVDGYVQIANLVESDHQGVSTRSLQCVHFTV